MRIPMWLKHNNYSHISIGPRQRDRIFHSYMEQFFNYYCNPNHRKQVYRHSLYIPSMLGTKDKNYVFRSEVDIEKLVKKVVSNFGLSRFRVSVDESGLTEELFEKSLLIINEKEDIFFNEEILLQIEYGAVIYKDPLSGKIIPAEWAPLPENLNSSASISFVGWSTDRSLSKKIWDLLDVENLLEVLPARRHLYSFVLNPRGGLSVESIDVIEQPFIETNYPESVVRAYHHIAEDIIAANPCGKLSIFTGPPGTGKTTLIKSLIGAIGDKALFVNLPVTLLPEINGPTLLSALMEFKDHYANEDGTEPIVLILEDADNVLAPRMMDNINHVQTLLNLGDGLIGQALNLRIIATTNQKQKEFDPALVRPGRLCTLQHFPLLTPEQAKRCYKHIAPGKIPPNFTKDVSLAEVYRMFVQNAGSVTSESTQYSVGFRAH